MKYPPLSLCRLTIPKITGYPNLNTARWTGMAVKNQSKNQSHARSVSPCVI